MAFLTGWIGLGWATSLGGEVGVVDMTALFQAHPETKKAEAALEAKRKMNREAYVASSNRLKEVLQKHQAVTRELVAAGREASAEQKKAAEDLLDEATRLETEVAKLATTQQRDLEQEFLAEKARIVALIAELVAKHNAEGRYQIILDKSALSSTGLPQVIHAPGADDLTEAIRNRFPKP